MSELLPPLSEKPRAKVAAPEFVFVENTRTSLYVLRWHDRQHPPPGAAATKYLGPGANLVASTIIQACTPTGGEFGDASNGVLSIFEPTKLREHEAVALAARTGSRQACHAWLKTEKRAAVIDALHRRLDRKPTPADMPEEDD